MSNRLEHLQTPFILIIIIIFVGFYFHKMDAASIMVKWGIVPLLLGAVLPDILNPPTSYRHRTWAHMKRLVKPLLWILLISLIASVIFWFFQFYWPIVSLFFAIGYSSHLALDSLTPMGLPE
jgi:membrane-bound metal-dependent hydrolase YbcI (DUF457 family)